MCKFEVTIVRSGQYETYAPLSLRNAQSRGRRYSSAYGNDNFGIYVPTLTLFTGVFRRDQNRLITGLIFNSVKVKRNLSFLLSQLDMQENEKSKGLKLRYSY